MPIFRRRCGVCRHHKKVSKYRAECRRFPPAGYTAAGWPDAQPYPVVRLDRDDWCGEWELRDGPHRFRADS